MIVKINKKEVDASGLQWLGELLVRENMAAPGMAVAIGNRVVPRREWDCTALTEGMEITVISAVCGG